MPRYFNDFRTDFPDEAPARRRATSWEPTPRVSPQRDHNTIARAYPVDLTNENVVTGRMRVDDRVAPRSQGRLDSDTRKPAISVRPGAQVSGIKSASHVRFKPDSLYTWPRTGFEAKAVAADRRMFGTTFPKTVYGTFAQTEASLRGRLRFVVPRSVVPCIQRKSRREVLFAKSRAGGAGSRKPKRRTYTSNIGC